MRQFKMLFYCFLALLTGAMGVCIYFLNGELTLAPKPVAVILLISFVGHMVAFLDKVKNQ